MGVSFMHEPASFLAYERNLQRRIENTHYEELYSYNCKLQSRKLILLQDYFAVSAIWRLAKNAKKVSLSAVFLQWNGLTKSLYRTIGKLLETSV